MPTRTNTKPSRAKPTKAGLRAARQAITGIKSHLALQFRHLDGGWRAYLDYVRYAAQGGDKDAERYLACHAQLTPREIKSKTPEEICEISGLKPADLFGIVQAALYEVSNGATAIILGAGKPKVLESTIKTATGRSKNASKAQELILKSTGILPLPKTQIAVFSGSAQPLPAGGARGALEGGVGGSQTPGMPLRLRSPEDALMSSSRAVAVRTAVEIPSDTVVDYIDVSPTGN